MDFNGYLLLFHLILLPLITLFATLIHISPSIYFTIPHTMNIILCRRFKPPRKSLSPSSPSSTIPEGYQLTRTDSSQDNAGTITTTHLFHCIRPQSNNPPNQPNRHILTDLLAPILRTTRGPRPPTPRQQNRNRAPNPQSIRTTPASFRPRI